MEDVATPGTSSIRGTRNLPVCKLCSNERGLEEAKPSQANALRGPPEPPRVKITRPISWTNENPPRVLEQTSAQGHQTSPPIESAQSIRFRWCARSRPRPANLSHNSPHFDSKSRNSPQFLFCGLETIQLHRAEIPRTESCLPPRNTNSQPPEQFGREL